MEQWGSATIRKKGSKDPNVLTLEEKTTVRPLEVKGSPVATWQQHIIENPTDANQIAFVVCPGRGCPLCRKPSSPKGAQYFPIQTRYAANVWSYAEKQEGVKVLIGGKQIFKAFDDAVEADIMPYECDWIILKEGKAERTKYTVQRKDRSPAAFTVEPDQLHDLSKFEKPASIQQIFDTLEKMGIDYDKLPIPSFTVDEALAFVLPYGKLKGQTIEAALAADEGYIDWMYNAKKDGGQFGDAVFLAIHTVLEDRGEVDPIAEVDSAPSESYEAPAEKTDAGGTPVEPATAEEAGPVMVTLVDADGGEVTVPESAADALRAAGYKDPQSPAPEQEAVQPSQAREVADDEIVQVSIAKGPMVPMPFSAAVATMNTPVEVAFEDSEVDAFAQTKLSFNQSDYEAKESVLAAGAADAEQKSEDEFPFKCGHPGCDSAYKGKGGLTQHINKKHGGEQPPEAGGDVTQEDDTPAPAPAAESNGSGGDEDREAVLERVKTLLAQHGSKDFTTLLEIFQEVAGKREVMQFTLPELLKLEERLQQGVG